MSILSLLYPICTNSDVNMKTKVHRIAMFTSDEIRLQRIVPFVTSLLQDSEPIVRASGINVLSSVLSSKYLHMTL